MAEGTVPATTPARVSPDYGYTYGRASGNRSVEGSGRLPDSEPLDVELGGRPAWAAGAALGDDTAWVVALENGRVEAFRVDGEAGSVEPERIVPSSLPAGAPPAVRVAGERVELLVEPEGRGSALTHPVPFGGGRLGVAEDGRLLVERGEDPRVRALPDARPVRSADGKVAVLSEPTQRYVHGVLGDDLEAASLTVLAPSGNGAATVGHIRPQSGGVFEAVAPLWFRPGPGQEELLAVTESAEGRGGRISVYRPNGELAAAGPFIGEGQKWRHLLAAGPFGSGGAMEISAMRTPHVAPRIEFYEIDLDAGELELAAEGPGYPSHAIYSRNLDAARAGDLDGDGRWELLVPDSDLDELVAVRHERSGSEAAWRLPLGGELSTNLASATTRQGRAQIAAGRADGVLRIWP